MFITKILPFIILPILSILGKQQQLFRVPSSLKRAVIAGALLPALMDQAAAVSGGGKEFAQKDIRGQDFSSQKFQGQDFTQCDGAGTNFQVSASASDEDDIKSMYRSPTYGARASIGRISRTPISVERISLEPVLKTLYSLELNFEMLFSPMPISRLLFSMLPK